MPKNAEPCEHFSEIRRVNPGTNGCADCIALGEKWNELRVCLTCGHVGCCDDSEHRHAREHFNTTGHPMIASFEPTETWGWCYIHRSYLDPMPGSLPQRRSALAAFFDRLIKR